MDGRDIGTVIFPDAKYKFFITATPEERARRRLSQEGERYDAEALAEVAKAIAERDEQDANRPIAPLKPAADSIVIDNTGLTLEGSMLAVLEHINKEA
jgi:cytidylate kinase